MLVAKGAPRRVAVLRLIPPLLLPTRRPHCLLLPADLPGVVAALRSAQQSYDARFVQIESSLGQIVALLSQARGTLPPPPPPVPLPIPPLPPFTPEVPLVLASTTLGTPL